MTTTTDFTGRFGPWALVAGGLVCDAAHAHTATKAFLLTLSEALWKELGDRGIGVTVRAAGPVLTPDYVASKPANAGPSALEMEPGDVARAALSGLGRRPLVTPGGLNRVARFFMGRLVSRRAAIRLLAKSTGAMYGGGAAGRQS